MRNQLLIKRNPSNKSWYVLGECLGYWMPISSPKSSRAEAVKWAKLQHLADSDARRESNGALNPSNQLG